MQYNTQLTSATISVKHDPTPPFPIIISGETQKLSHFKTSVKSTWVCFCSAFRRSLSLSLPTIILELFSASGHQNTSPSTLYFSSPQEKQLILICKMQASNAVSDTSWLAITVGSSFSVFLFCLNVDSRWDFNTQKSQTPTISPIY